LTLALAGCDVEREWYEYHHEPPPQAERSENRQPVFTLVFVAPLETGIGGDIALSAAAKAVGDGSVSFRWEGKGGVIKKPTAPETTFTCRVAGRHTLAVRATSADGTATMSVPITCLAKGDH
jgi:hypothetical protein